MVKIAIDISPTLNGNQQRGVGFYTSRLVTALQEELKTNPQYKDWSISLESSVQNQESFDLVHYPYFDPFFLTLPLRRQTPIVVTVHDLIPLEFSPHFPAGLKGKLRWLVQKHRLLQADYLITDSHSSKYQIYDHTHYPLDRIYSIHLAADPIYQPLKNQKNLKKIKEKYSLPDKFVLYVGDINWNKNVPNLVKACQELKYSLVIVGGAAVSKNIPDNPWTSDLRWLQNQAADSSLLILTGFVPDLDLAAIYNLATLYCQPSYAEGFGLNPLEAMQSGCPVVYSQETSLNEVMDFSGIMFDPYDSHSLPQALSQMWTNSKTRADFIKKGLKQASLFSWSQTARQTLAVYQLALLHEKK